MIRAIRPNAMAQDDATPVSGWNVAPNLAYTLDLLPGMAACGVVLYDELGATLLASGAALVGSDQPCILMPQYGQSIGMIDPDLGWHLLLTTDGTETPRTIRIGPAVDLPDEVHPVYADDDLAVARARAGVDEHAHYIDDISVTCPFGLGAVLRDVVSVPVDGVTAVGQVESITWTGTPDGASEQAVIRKYIAIAPEPWVDPVPIGPPVVADDAGATTADETTSGNVLTNDETDLTVVAVNGLSGNVGQPVTGNNGGVFIIDEDGTWTFDPDGDFEALEGSETADTSVNYHASDGVSEAMATLTVTVSSGAAVPWTPAMIPGAVWVDADTVTLSESAVTAITDKVGGTIQATQGTPNARPTLIADALGSEDVIQFDGGDFLSFGTVLGKPANWSIFMMGMFASMGAKTSLCGSGNSAGASATYWGDIGVGRTANDGKIEYSFGNGTAYSYGRSSNAVITSGAWFMAVRRYASGQDKPVDRVNGVARAVTKQEGTATTCGGTAYAYTLGRCGEFAGHYATPGSRLKGFLFVPSAISDADAARLEGYYAHVCGRTDLLPSDHAYKSVPPYLE